MAKKTLFVLGGNDGEMSLIKTLLNMGGKFTIQPKKEWGIHLYSPEDVGVEPRSVVDEFKKYFYNGTPLDEVVFVECFPRSSAWEQSNKLRVNISIVDHHAGDSWERASIMQILQDYCPDVQVSETLRRLIELSAANDTGYIPAMESLFATRQEIDAVRLADRRAQGITKQMEEEAERAIQESKRIGTSSGHQMSDESRQIGELQKLGVTVIKMAHSKTATVTDRLYFEGIDQLVILSGDGEANFYGDGLICQSLSAKFQGWSGGTGLGQEGQSAFWGGYPDQNELLNYLKEGFTKK